MRGSLTKTHTRKPLKNMPATDAIFDQGHHANQASDQDQKSWRLSLERQAKGTIGHRSRGGKDRTKEATKADDHDTQIKAIVVHFGILDVLGNALTIFFGQSHETSDFIVDCLESWWHDHAHQHPDVEELAINLDNGWCFKRGYRWK